MGPDWLLTLKWAAGKGHRATRSAIIFFITALHNRGFCGSNLPAALFKYQRMSLTSDANGKWLWREPSGWVGTWMASGQHIPFHQLGNYLQGKFIFCKRLMILNKRAFSVLEKCKSLYPQGDLILWLLKFDRLMMFETRCLGGGVQAPCYSGRCPAEGARELPKKRVHAGKSSSASAAGKGRLPICKKTRGTFWKCVSKLAFRQILWAAVLDMSNLQM